MRWLGPQIGTVNPTRGPLAGGYAVTITASSSQFLGDGFDVVQVRFGTLVVLAAGLSSQTTSVVVVTAPLSPASALVDVEVTSTSYGSGVKANAFTFMPGTLRGR